MARKRAASDDDFVAAFGSDDDSPGSDYEDRRPDWNHRKGRTPAKKRRAQSRREDDEDSASQYSNDASEDSLSESDGGLRSRNRRKNLPTKSRKTTASDSDSRGRRTTRRKARPTRREYTHLSRGQSPIEDRRDRNRALDRNPVPGRKHDRGSSRRDRHAESSGSESTDHHKRRNNSGANRRRKDGRDDGDDSEQSESRERSSSNENATAPSGSEDQREGYAFEDVRPVAKLVKVPEFHKTSFPSWAAFEEQLEAYCKTTHQLITGKSSVPRRARNKKIREQIAKEYFSDPRERERELGRRLIPDDFETYAKTLGCTHFGKPRERPTSGQRPNQIHRAIGCPCKMSVCLKYDPERQAWRVCVTKQKNEHNHRITKEIYESYPEVRNVTNERVLSTVRAMYTYGTSRKGILAYMSENASVKPDMKDVHNLLAKMKAERYAEFPTVEARVKAFLGDFCSLPGHVGRVFTDEKKVVKCVTLQTAHMRSMFNQFPEVLLIDATHNTNKARYKLFSFMVHDALGRGQHVQHSLIENERAETLRTACAQFKRVNPLWHKIRCIIMDKDFTEMAVIAAEFPDARILLCQWHVENYLCDEVRKRQYGLTAWQVENMKIVIKECIDAPTEAIYDKKIEFMKSILGTEAKIKTWFDYFDANWSSCKDKWCSFLRCELPHLGNNTNNRLESSWHKLKSLVDKFSEFDECLVAILFWQRSKELAWRRRVEKIGRVRVADGDEEINKLAGVVSQYAVKLVRSQYEFAMKETTRYHHYALRGPVTLISYIPPGRVAPDPRVIEDDNDEDDEDDDTDVPNEYHVNTRNWSCSCPFMMTRLLPCRHVLYLRRLQCPRNIIPITKINTRWVLDNFKNIERLENEVASEDVEPFQTERVKKSAQQKVLTSNQRFNKLLQVGKEIAECASHYGTAHVLDVEKALSDFLAVLKIGDIPAVTSEGSRIEMENEPDGRSNENVDAVATDSRVSASESWIETQSLSGTESCSSDHASSTSRPVLSVAAVNALFGENEDGEDQDEVNRDEEQPGRDANNDDDALDDTCFDLQAEGERADGGDAGRDSGEEDAVPTRDDQSEQGRGAYQSEEEFFISNSATAPGRARQTKKMISMKKSQARAESQRNYRVFVRQGRLPSTSHFAGSAGRQQIRVKTHADDLDALRIVDPHAKPRVFLAEKRSETHLGELRSTLPNHVITIAERAMRTFVAKQDTRDKLQPTDTVVSLGSMTYSMATLRLMRSINMARENFTIFRKGLQWLRKKPCLSDTAQEWLSCNIPYARTRHYMEEVDLAAREASVLSFCPTSHLDGDAIMETMKCLQYANEHRTIFYLPPSLTTVPQLFEALSSTPAAQSLSGPRLLPGTEALADNTLLLVALHFDDPDHWCGVVVNFADYTVIAFDPFQSRQRYTEIDRWIVSYLIPAIPRLQQASFSFRRFSGVQQLDSYNCGVFVLLFFESIIHDFAAVELDSIMSSELLSHARYRYLSMNLVFMFGDNDGNQSDRGNQGDQDNDSSDKSGDPEHEEVAQELRESAVEDAELDESESSTAMDVMAEATRDSEDGASLRAQEI